jgi:conserved oligomeric Golgi complex subunit 5
VVGCIEGMLGRVDGLVCHVRISLALFDSRRQVVKDRSAVVLQKPSATPQQVVNGQLASCLYHCWSRLQSLEDEHTESLLAILSPSIQVN